VLVAKKLRKPGKKAEVVSVGPPKKEPDEEKVTIIVITSSDLFNTSEITPATKGEKKKKGPHTQREKKINKHGYNNYIPANLLFHSLVPPFTYHHLH
jgi:hypothetical protein